MTNSWWCYIVRCADGSLYTGIAKDVARRIKQHNAGKGARCITKSRRPVKLVWSDECFTRSIALRVEARIKNMTKEKKGMLISGIRR